jgi:hypothetical protein
MHHRARHFGSMPASTRGVDTLAAHVAAAPYDTHDVQ